MTSADHVCTVQLALAVAAVNPSAIRGRADRVLSVQRKEKSIVETRQWMNTTHTRAPESALNTQRTTLMDVQSQAHLVELFSLVGARTAIVEGMGEMHETVLDLYVRNPQRIIRIGLY